MRKYVSRIENNSTICVGCYGLPLFAILLLGLSVYLTIGICTVIGVFSVLAARESRLRFHAFQAAVFLIAAASTLWFTYWLIFGADQERLTLQGDVTPIVIFGQIVFAWAVIVLLFLSAYTYAAVKAAFGKDVRLPVIGNLAGWIGRDLPVVAPNFITNLRKISTGEHSLNDHLPHVGLVVAAIILIGFLTMRTTPSAFSPQALPQGIKASSIAEVESFAGFPWDIDSEKTKQLAKAQGWKTGDFVSSMTGLGCRAFLEGYPASLQFFYVRDKTQFQYEHLYQGFIMIHGKDAPVRELYQQFRELLIKKYGYAVEQDYPPWRSQGAPPYGPGFGSKWEITNQSGQKVVVYLAHKIDEQGYSSDSSHKFTLEIRYRNVSVYDKSLKGE